MASNAAVKPSNETLPISTGIDKGDRKQLADLLEKALANTYVLYTKIQGVHWNVTGPHFYGIHKMTQEQYEDLAQANDDLAERIRALGYLAPTTMARFIQMSDVKEAGHEPDARKMLEVLARDHQTVAKVMRDAVSEAGKVDDVFTADMLTARIGTHEKFAWMLRASLGK